MVGRRCARRHGTRRARSRRARAPAAHRLIEEHRDAGRLVVLATTSPHAFVEPFAELLGLDDVIATRWRLDADGTTFTGRIDGDFVWGRAKAKAVEAWAADHGVDLARATPTATATSTRRCWRWSGIRSPSTPTRSCGPRPPCGAGPCATSTRPTASPRSPARELQEWTRPFMRPELVAPNARVEIEGIENIPATGAAIVVFNHRSYFDPAVMSLVLAKAGRNMRLLGQEGGVRRAARGRLARAMGGIRVDRGTGLRRAARGRHRRARGRRAVS